MTFIITDLDGNFIKEGIDFNPDNEMMVRTPFPRDENGQIGFWAPKWDGEKWIETGQAPEPQPQEPTVEERLEQTEELLKTVTMAFTEYVFTQGMSDDS